MLFPGFIDSGYERSRWDVAGSREVLVLRPELLGPVTPLSSCPWNISSSGHERFLTRSALDRREGSQLCIYMAVGLRRS